MQDSTLHRFHVPVMGTGFTIDSALRIAKLGIDSAMSLADDRLIERVRKHYAGVFGLPFEPIRRTEPDARERRITAYLDLVDAAVATQMSEIKALPFARRNDKTRWFQLLPESSPLRRRYEHFRSLSSGLVRETVGRELTAAMRPGSIDANIMTKLDLAARGAEGELSDAKAALRGFARSTVDGSMVFSAGINPALFGLLEELEEFHRDEMGRLRKKVILKVSDFRSALVQGKFLAKKGIEVHEIRVESGLNCGGHAFSTDGLLLGPILDEFSRRRRELEETFEEALAEYAAKKGGAAPLAGRRIRLTVQGGIGMHGEARRLEETYGVDATGWGSPFLLVPEVTALDDATRAQLADAKEDDLYLSDVSPLGVPFNNLRGSSSELRTRDRVDDGRPGSACPNGYLAFNGEFERPLCTASAEYQREKLAALGHATPPSWEDADENVRALYRKQCLCDHLGNGALIGLGIGKEDLPVAVCPGPNIAWFGHVCSLEEMVDHIYGRAEASLVPESRPHMFANELAMNLTDLEAVCARQSGDRAGARRVEAYRKTLREGLDYYRMLVNGPAFPGENLASLREAIDAAVARLDAMETPVALSA